MKAKYLMLALVALVMSSCSSLHKTSQVSNVCVGVAQYPTVTDLVVSPQKVEKSVEWAWNPIDLTSVQNRKDNLVADLLAEHNADVLVEPQFKVETRCFSGGSITVTGYPAKFKDFRKATDADLKALEAGSPWMRNACPPPHKKHGLLNLFKH